MKLIILSILLSAGSIQAQWISDTRLTANLSSGMYFYTLQSDGFVETKKMMLIK